MATNQSSRAIKFDPDKFENIHQVGGIRTGTLDSHPLGGPGGRVALVDTGAGLRFTVALDRGGDIVDARFNQHELTYLTPNGLGPPNHAYHTGVEWIYGWAGGLVTTCGPQYMGGPREEDGVKTSLHGHYSNLPAAVEQLINPDPHRGRLDMQIGLVVRDSRMFGPVMEVRRTIRCTLGEPEIIIEDEVTNRANTRSAHHWLYHCNLGYPLLDRGARFVYRGKAQHWVLPAPPGQTLLQPISADAMNKLKHVPDPLPAHAGFGERGLIVEVTPDKRGICRAGLINNRLKLGMPLQVDAVFGYIYGRDTYSPSLTDLKVNSPYNSYTHKELPPGPIDNPGLDSIDAAIHPTKTGYLYYLTDKNGVMHYATTFAQHQANQQKYLR